MSADDVCAIAVDESDFDRLLELQSYDILDTPPEPGFDGLTSLASFVCDAPIAMVSFVDAERQWFKSKLGVTHDESPRDESFCNHALTSSAILEVIDTRLDPRFAAHRSVTGEPHYRFYAGAPLVTSSGHVLGTLCVLDVVPRTLSERQRSHLRILADQVVDQLELRRSAKRFAAEVSARLAADSALRDQRRLLVGVLNHTDVLIYAKDVGGRYVMANAALETLVGGPLIGRRDQELFDHETAEGHRRNDRHIMSTRERQIFSEDIVLPDGSARTFRSTKFPLIDDGGAVIGVAGVSTDVTELASARAAHAQAERRWRAVVEQLPAAVVIVDAGGLLGYANVEACTMLGAPSSDSIEGVPVLRFVPQELHTPTEELLRSVLIDGHDVRSRRGALNRRGGDEFTVEFSARRVDDDGSAGVQIEFRDVTSLDAAHAALKQSACTDVLTGLLNRRAWEDQVTARLADPRYSGSPMTLAVIDIDHFKAFNDTNGHVAGDALLRQFATAADASLRHGDVLARWGGEEFILALPDTTPRQAKTVLHRIRRCLPHGQTCSIGYTVHSTSEPLTDTIVRADQAMYRAKAAGRNQISRLERPLTPRPATEMP